MKDFIFLIYALFFNFGARLGVKENRVGLVSMHNARFADGLGEVERELKSRGDAYDFVKVERTDLASPFSALKFITCDAFRLGRAKYIFLNDNFMALSCAKPNRETEIVQLWHGMGAFKKFGFDIDVPQEIRKREAAQNAKLTAVICSSEGVKSIYAGAFGIDADKVYPIGSPASDYYFRNGEKETAKANLLKLYPELEGKYIILYAPTFREDPESDAKLLSHFNAADLSDENTAVLVRLHPQVHGSSEIKDAIDVTDYPNVNELCIAADMLITDYSSICMDFALQKKPTVFYAFDLDSYKGARDFYFTYEGYVPGPVAKTEEELKGAVNEARETVSPKLEAFRKFNFDEPDGKATERLVNKMFKF